MGNLSIFMDGQFGSCGKGAVVSSLAQRYGPGAVVRVGGPQAGHSMLGPCPPSCKVDHPKHTWKMRHMPCAWHVDPQPQLIIGRGTVINLDVLRSEIEAVETTLGYPPQLLVDADAFVVTPDQINEEKRRKMSAGSTREGTGATRAAAAMREALRIRDMVGVTPWLEPFIRENTYQDIPRFSAVWLEASQGFGLSLRASGNYPYVTSVDITPPQLLSDMGVHWSDFDVIRTHLLLRTFPIRIAGNSGELDEIGWDDLPVPPDEPETTTVTGMQRRIGNFDYRQAKKAVRACRPESLIPTFLDYLLPEHRAPFCDYLIQETGVPISFVSEGFEQVRPYGVWRSQWSLPTPTAI